MIEAQLRAKGPALQRAYDRMPYPVQNFLTSARGWFLTRNRYAPGMYSYLGELRRHEKWSTDEITSFQLNAIGRSRLTMSSPSGERWRCARRIS